VTRRAGVLIPLFSLRGGGWGLGAIPDLVPFARWARSAGFTVVQILPVCEPAGGQASPYYAQTAFALDQAYLSLDGIAERPEGDWVGGPHVSWNPVRRHKREALEAAFARLDGLPEEARAFMSAEADWLDDYALFAALHERHDVAWEDWPEPLRLRDPAALAEARTELGPRIQFFSWVQWHLDRQWKAARAEMNALGVKLMGDLPFMVAGDSADVWSHQDEFRLDARAGVPPDAFSDEGQDWGLPVYRWDVMEAGGFQWIGARARRAVELFDLYRVDHVVGFYRTFFREGREPVTGPGEFTPAEQPDQLALGETNLGIFGHDHVIAEDLGVVPDFVRESLTRLGVPGYRVFRWEKDVDVFRDPAAWPPVSVATTGTHDTESLADWYDELEAAEREAFWEIPGLEGLRGKERFDDEVREAVLAALYRSPSELALVPFQDAMGARERVNVPGTLNAENWSYRMPMRIDELAADEPTSTRLRALAEKTGRS
jgi:4-alpha-glucanotransferase